jgi:FkbH-like protein
MKLIDIIKKNRELESGFTKETYVYNIAVITNITLAHFQELLELRLREKGVFAKVTMGEYNSILMHSSRYSSYNAVIIFWEPCNFTEGFSSRWEIMPPHQFRALQESTEMEIETVLSGLDKVPLVLFNKFTSSIFSGNALGESRLTRFCEDLNDTLASRVSSSQVVVDLEKVIGRVGYYNAFDFRQFQSSMNLYSLEFLKKYVEVIMPALLGANGIVKKVLVLDCDNTLWGGTVGEDGLNGIQLGCMTPRGKIFQEVQTICKALRMQGVLLALCSKNDLFEVDRVFSEHPGMILIDDDITSKKVNWSSKVENLLRLAEELNLGLESFVFVDDTPFEIGLVQQALPQVTCVTVPEEISEYPEMMRQMAVHFFKLSSSDEDARRTMLYRQDHLRKKHLTKFNSLEDYLTSLRLSIELRLDFDRLAARMAQLTQKTNQFNLTTKRYSEEEIRQLIIDPRVLVLSLGVKDLFGDYGETGLAVIRFVGEGSLTCEIDTFLMSCRILGRNIEYRFFDEIVGVLRSRGVERITANYRVTAKNSQVSSFYDNLGFDVSLESHDHKAYELSLRNYTPSGVKFIECHSEI